MLAFSLPLSCIASVFRSISLDLGKSGLTSECVGIPLFRSFTMSNIVNDPGLATSQFTFLSTTSEVSVLPEVSNAIR